MSCFEDFIEFREDVERLNEERRKERQGAARSCSPQESRAGKGQKAPWG
jgi:hypothetical protein